MKVFNVGGGYYCCTSYFNLCNILHIFFAVILRNLSSFKKENSIESNLKVSMTLHIFANFDYFSVLFFNSIFWAIFHGHCVKYS